MNIFVGTGDVKYVPREKRARTIHPLVGCFVSVVLNDKGEAIMGHYGPHPSFGEFHFEVIKRLKEEYSLENVCGATLFYLGNNEGLALTFDEYLSSRDSLKNRLENLLDVEVKTRTYVQGSAIELSPERKLGVVSFWNLD